MVNFLQYTVKELSGRGITAEVPGRGAARTGMEESVTQRTLLCEPRRDFRNFKGNNGQRVCECIQKTKYSKATDEKIILYII